MKTQAVTARRLSQIVDRAVAMAKKYGVSYETGDCRMDLIATNRTVPLDWRALIAFDDGNFGHDVFGIRRHLNRHTLALENCFVPRCALSQK